MKIGARLYYYRVVIGHKIVVFYYTLKFCKRLLGRALKHDLRKFSEDEVIIVAPALRQFKTLIYGTNAYSEMCDDVRMALATHYARNTHHPEHFTKFDHDHHMTLLDRIEMVIDWAAASRKGVGVFRSIGINETRFGFDKQQKQEYIDIAKAIEGK